MGNTLISLRLKVIIFLVLVGSSILSVIISFPYAKKILPTSEYKIEYHRYRLNQAVLAAAPPANLLPAKAVPVLMYHGVIDRVETVNTSINNFINQMEALKKNGYTTISVREFDLFRQGKFVLPPKPIIITFDDGRKDSYYTTDDVFRQFGFKATIFVATAPAINGNSFYLTWEELKKMKESGRWEIEAHGRHSHETIPISTDENDYGRYLSSRMYLADKKRLETVLEFEERVEKDYLDAVRDLESNLGIRPQYFAIPLNDYGEQPISNYPPSTDFNHKLMKKYFRLGFVQANSSTNPSRITAPVYNFAHTNPYSIYRLEAKNLSANELMEILERETPNPPKLNLAGNDFRNAEFDKLRFAGTIIYSPEGLSLTASQPAANGQIIFGKNHWLNYEVTATMRQTAGRSVVLLFNFQDQKNYLAFGRTDNGYFLRETVDNVTADLEPPYRPNKTLSNKTPVTLKIISKNGLITGYVDGEIIFSQVATSIPSGGVGFKVWGDSIPGSGILQKLSVNEA